MFDMNMEFFEHPFRAATGRKRYQYWTFWYLYTLRSRRGSVLRAHQRFHNFVAHPRPMPHA